MKFGLKAILVIFLTAFFCIYPPLRNYKQNDIKAAFDYFAADAFYYLNVADNYQKTGFSTYDGIHSTNGFHPLWQYILNFSFTKIDNPEVQIKFVFFLSILLVSLGAVFLSIALLKFFDSFSLSLITIIPGFLFLLFSFVVFPYGSPWSFMNGMETPLSIFLFGLFFLILSFSKDLNSLGHIKLFILSVFLTFITFSRLDDIFLLVAFSILLIFKSERKERLRKSIIFLAFPFTLLTAYLIYNLSYSGFLLPVSGLIKSNFSFDNFIYTFSSLTSFGIKDNFFGEHSYWRVIFLWIPLLFAAYYLNKNFSKSSNEFWILIPLSFYIVIKALYDLFFVNFWDQGHWYFALSIIITNILIGETIQKFKTNKIPSILVVISVLIITIIYANFFMEKFRFKENKYYEFWQKRHKIEKQISEIYEGKGIIEFDDGIIAWSLNYPIISGTGLNLDKEAFEYYKKGEFIDLAVKRAYSAMASVLYINPPNEALTDSVKFNNWIKNSFPALKKQNLENWKFSLKFYDKETNFYLVGIEEKN
ncbi:MAG: hypothetical protein N2319_09370 [Candidatus Kapabacteria bacterium]|nr:hypothetical protein [Candidatus Kapabacteria bacterium]